MSLIKDCLNESRLLWFWSRYLAVKKYKQHQNQLLVHFLICDKSWTFFLKCLHMKTKEFFAFVLFLFLKQLLPAFVVYSEIWFSTHVKVFFSPFIFQNPKIQTNIKSCSSSEEVKTCSALVRLKRLQKSHGFEIHHGKV